ncbi:hypothetical protein [Clostridium saccharoperbutylacetonicum]
MSKAKRKRLKLNVKLVACARSPGLCKQCEEQCEKMDLFYYPYSKRDIRECFKNCGRKT